MNKVRQVLEWLNRKLYALYFRFWKRKRGSINEFPFCKRCKELRLELLHLVTYHVRDSFSKKLKEGEYYRHLEKCHGIRQVKEKK